MHPARNHPRRWPRHLIAVAALVWFLGAAAGCHLAQTGFAAARSPSASTVSVGNFRAEPLASGRVDADCCRAATHDCMPVAQSWGTAGQLAPGFTIAALASVALRPALVRPPTRGPPRPGRVVVSRPGRSVLTRICISRV
ncbi:putative copper homeostasis (lipo)protein LpqS [Mycobacterium interjectum]